MKMNRIIVIGNGFDLAHGLETRYSDFINDFWEEEKKKVLASGLTSYFDSYNTETKYKYKCENYEIIMKSPDIIKNSSSKYGYDWFNFIRNHQDGMLHMKNVFLDAISKKMDQLWVNIEVEYYRRLCSCLEDKYRKLVETHNKEFLETKTALEDYLKRMLKRCPICTVYDHNCFYKKIPNLDRYPIERLFLNFNYTRTIDSYVAKVDSIINIHGDLKDPNNPIIFGYGDEMDERHKLIENTYDNEFLKYMKTTEYLNTDNYRQLQTFIEADKYEILIAGHSCGLSDRTLLNHLFEHTHCQKIKIFYHARNNGTDDFKDILYNVYRCFNDKSQMRNIVECKTNSWTLQKLLEKKVRVVRKKSIP
jgi:hypothetical protein